MRDWRRMRHGDGQLLKHLEVAVRRILPISPFPKFNTLPVKHHSIVSVLLCVFVEGSNTSTLFRYSSTVSAQSPNSRINPCTCQHTQQPAYNTTAHTTQLQQQDCSGQQANCNATGSSATGSSVTGSSATGSSATGSSATGSSAAGISAAGCSSGQQAASGQQCNRL